MTKVEHDRSIASAFVYFGLIGAMLTVINNIVATVALGVAQGPIVAFTTPFAFCLGRLRYPKYPAAIVIYFPVVVVSIFTLNFGPPGPYKVAYLLGAVLYDGVCYILRAGYEKTGQIPLWKLLIAVVLFPIGLVAGASLALSWVTVEIPILSRAWVGVVIMVCLFLVIGGFATWLCRRVYYGMFFKNAVTS